MSDFLKTISTNVRYYRKKAKLTQKALGDLIGSSAFTISRWESGDAVPTAVDMALICDTLNVDPAVLLGVADESSTRDEIDDIILTRYRAVPDHVRKTVNMLLGIE